MIPCNLVESTDFWSGGGREEEGEREREGGGERERVFNVTRLSVAKLRTGGK